LPRRRPNVPSSESYCSLMRCLLLSSRGSSERACRAGLFDTCLLHYSQMKPPITEGGRLK
jgi:hypothetical protein